MSKHKNQDITETPNEGQVTDRPTDQAAGGPARAEPDSGAFEARATAAEAKAATADAKAAAAEARVAELEAEVSSLKDQYLRKLADYENFRKRMFREKEDAVQYANSQILGDLVAVLDDFERAIKSSELSRDFSSLHDGVGMIQKNLLSTLAGKYGLTHFESVGAAFDPNVHEAVMSEPGDCPEPTVVEEFIKGYKLRDRVLRSAKVKVCMPRPSGDSNEQTAPEAKA
ncbi:MAG: nucleotide exchange factor GrpE [Spirochaetaceae bacterium]|nr:nucleotide exchange factor GrpE [Spirochaetaceae bacterium]